MGQPCAKTSVSCSNIFSIMSHISDSNTPAPPSGGLGGIGPVFLNTQHFFSALNIQHFFSAWWTQCYLFRAIGEGGFNPGMWKPTWNTANQTVTILALPWGGGPRCHRDRIMQYVSHTGSQQLSRQSWSSCTGVVDPSVPGSGFKCIGIVSVNTFTRKLYINVRYALHYYIASQRHGRTNRVNSGRCEQTSSHTGTANVCVLPLIWVRWTLLVEEI